MNVTNFKGELTKLFNSIQKLADESQEKNQIIRNLKNKGNSSNLRVLVNKLFQYIKEINEVFSAEPENRLRMLNVLKEKIDQKHLSVDAIKKKIAAGEDIIGREEKYKVVEMDENFPEFIIKNRDKYEGWII